MQPSIYTLPTSNPGLHHSCGVVTQCGHGANAPAFSPVAIPPRILDIKSDSLSRIRTYQPFERLVPRSSHTKPATISVQARDTESSILCHRIAHSRPRLIFGTSHLVGYPGTFPLSSSHLHIHLTSIKRYKPTKQHPQSNQPNSTKQPHKMPSAISPRQRLSLLTNSTLGHDVSAAFKASSTTSSRSSDVNETPAPPPSPVDFSFPSTPKEMGSPRSSVERN